MKKKVFNIKTKRPKLSGGCTKISWGPSLVLKQHKCLPTTTYVISKNLHN